MKKFFSICLLSLLAISAAAQSSDQRYRLTVKALPAGVISVDGYFYPPTGSYERFKGDDNGQAVCSVPANGKVTINFTDKIGGYKLKSATSNGLPISVGTFNSQYQISNYAMPAQDVEMVMLFEYDPGAPDYEPGAGSWDPETGTLILDNGYNGNYPTGFNFNDDKDKVLRLILGGNSNYYLNVRNFVNCIYFDCSRTAWETIEGNNYGNGMMQGLSAVEVVLPSTLKSIASKAFQGTVLQTLVCFAMTPPALSGSTSWNAETGKSELIKQNSFPDSPDMVVRVPADAVELYRNAPGWKEFAIVPMDQNYVNLKVLLMAQPDADRLARYKNMQVELTSLTNGQVRRLLMSGRNEYEFRYLPENTAYSVALLSSRGQEVAKIDNIYLEKSDKQVTFSQLKDVHQLTLRVMADGVPVGEGLFSNTWLKATGDFLGRSTTISDVLDGDRLRYIVSIDRSLATQYLLPDTVDITVGQQSDNIVYDLQAIPQKDVSFIVVDSLTKKGIDKATIQVAQLFAMGERGATTTLTTGSDGRAAGKLPAVPAAIIVNSPMHGSQTMEADLSATNSVRVTFLQANGTTIKLGHTYQPAVSEGQEQYVEQNYSGGRNLEYTFTAVMPDGSDSVITRFLANYPLYTLYSDLPRDTKVRVSATSVIGAIEPVEVEGTVDENRTVSVTLPIVQRGYIQASYYRSESKRPAILVFDEQSGELKKRDTFNSDSTITITKLTPGSYLVAAMSQGIQYSSISSLAQLKLYVEGTDYVANSVSVSDGRIANVLFPRVPLATSQLETNLEKGSASWSDAGITLGHTVSLGVNVVFKNLKEREWGTDYDDSLYPTNCKLEVYVPDGFTQPTAYRSYRLYTYSTSGMFYEGQNPFNARGTIDDLKALDNPNLRVGPTYVQYVNATAEWNESERKLTVDWPHIDEVGKMNLTMVPTLANIYKPEVYLTYTLGGVVYREMLQTDNLSVSRSAINAPELVITPTFTVSGKAMYVEETAADTSQGDEAAARKSANETRGSMAYLPVDNTYYHVTVMDGDRPIGKAEINAQGEWTATCTLADAYALSRHNIYAHIAYPGKDGFSYNTESKEVTYDPNGVVPIGVKMSFFNHHHVHLINQDVYFDLQSQKATPKSYGYSNEDGYNTDFTFEINLSNNDPAKVYAVDLAIFTEGPDAESFIIPAHYNARKNRWIAYEKFNTRSLPYNVNVRPYYHGDVIGSRSMVQQTLDNYNSWFGKDEVLDAHTSWLSDFVSQMERAIAAGNESMLPDLDALLPKLYELDEHIGFDTESSTVPSADVDMAALQAGYDKLMQAIGDLDKYYGGNALAAGQIGQIEGGANISSAAGLTRAGLIAAGYDTMALDDGSELFIKTADDGSLEIVDLIANIVMRNSGNAAASRRLTPEGDEAYAIELYNKLAGAIDEFKGNLDILSTLCTNFSDALQLFLSDSESIIKSTEDGIRYVLSQKGSMSNSALASNLISRSKSLIKLQTQVGILKQAKKALDHFRVGRGIGTLASLYSLISDFVSFYTDTGRLFKIRNSLPNPCPDDQASRDQLSSDILTAIITSLIYQVAVIANDVIAVYVAATSVGSAVATGGASVGPSLLGIAESLFQMGLSLAAKHIYSETMKDNINEFAYSKSQLRCHKDKKDEDVKKRKNCTDCGDGGGGGGSGGSGGSGGGAGGSGSGGGSMGGGAGGGSTPMLDPSGYVYEGVPSNRLEGVTATVFYKQVTKDMFGNDTEKAIPWLAEDYGQVNPQLTDRNGEYGWMVPTGLWQVKYEKEGYNTEYSDWLPVPPPQLDVNQPMTQYSQPVVSDVKATPASVLVTFDKFMTPSTLNSGNVSVSRGGQPVGGTLQPVTSGTDTAYVQRVRFVPTTPLPAGQTLRLAVSGQVESYAGIRMGEAFTQDFTIEQTVEQIVADSAVHVVYDQPTVLTIQALPAQAAAGKTIVANILSDIASLEGNHLPSLGEGSGVGLLLDSDGRATLTLTGEAHGTTGLLLQMQDDALVQAVVVVNVKDESDFICPAPEANYVDGIELEYGSLITLSCDVPEAVIYYTLDGTCPCDIGSASVHRYDGPIALTGSMTLKAMATAPGYADSDVAEYSFWLTAIASLPDDTRQPAAATYNMAGQRLQQGAALGKGVYIINGKKTVVK